MPKQAKIEVRLDDADIERWRDAAVGAGLTLSMFVRQCVEDTIAVGSAGTTAVAETRTATKTAKAMVTPKRRADSAPADPTAKRGRTSMCPHRRAPDEFCSRCDA